MDISKFFKVEIIEPLAIVWMDNQGEKQNIISPVLFDVFMQVFEELENNPKIKGIVLASSKKDFLAGADIKSFKAEKPGDFLPIAKRGHSLLNKMAASSKPIVAAINGTCYGAGVEISLACQARVCSNSGHTKLALPEVKLGLLPGGGGTQRLPRLVGIQKALDIMLTGKNIYPSQALRMGLVDEITDESKLIIAASNLCHKIINGHFVRKDKRSLKDKIIEGPLKNMVYNQAKKMVTKMTNGNYPAPYEIIDCVAYGMKNGMDKGLENEVNKFEKLILSPESKQLRNLFFAMTEKKKNPYESLIVPIDTIGVLGAGFMGAGITEVSIDNHMNVLLKDINPSTISNGLSAIYGNIKSKLRKKSISSFEAEKQMARVNTQLDYRGFERIPMVIEAVFEDLAIKHKVLNEVESVTADNCIFASNTSALPITAIAAKSKRPENIIGMHYFSPVPKMPLLEIIKTAQTAEWVIGTCLDVGIRQGKTCIVVKDGPGFYTTRILAPMLNEALLVLEEGGDLLQIDKALQQYGYPVGPVTLMDEVGIDVGAHVIGGELIKHFIATRKDVKASTKLLEMSKDGYAGRKNKKGFYQYDANGKKIKGKVNKEVYNYFGGPTRKSMDEQDLAKRIAYMMVNEALLCLQEGIIDNPMDGDIGAIFGLGFPPFRGGPFRFLDEYGMQNWVNEMNQLATTHGERFRPASISQNYLNDKDKFYIS